MSKKNDAWGIEVGANAIKALRLTREGDQATVADYEVLPFKKILTTPDLDVDEQIQLNLDQLMQRHDLTHSTVVVSVSGHAAFARFAKLPPVEPKKIPDIVKFEAQQQIPFPIDRVEWDYQVFQHEDSPDVEVGIFAITKDRVAEFLDNYRAVGLNIDGMTLSPLAVYNALSYDLDLDKEGGKEGGVILMDIGTTSTDIIIVENGGIWLRTMPMGGNNFTEALMRAFKLSYHRAEKLKKEAGTHKHSRQIFQAMRPVFADLVQEVQKSLGYYQSLNREANLTKLIGVGSTFRLPGMQKFLTQQLQLEVERLDTFKRIAMEGPEEAKFADQSLNMATAYGLALQGLELEHVSANILPHHILKQRLWKAKQPIIAAAAGLMLVASGLALTKLVMDKAAYSSGWKEKNNRGAVTQLINQGKNLQTQMKKVQGNDPRGSLENLSALLDYRDTWAKITTDVSMAIRALNPADVTLTTDYEAWSKIPIPQRNRVYVTGWDVSYLPPEPPPPPTEEELRANRGRAPEPVAMGPGRYRVVVKGYLYSKSDVAGYDLFGEFRKAMEDQANRAPRPYRVKTITGPKISQREVIDPAATDTSSGTGTGPGPEESPSGFGFGGSKSKKPKTDASGPGRYRNLLPERPPVIEPDNSLKKIEFEFNWDLEVRPPEQLGPTRRKDVDKADDGKTPASDGN